MILVAILVATIGFYLLYNTSLRADKRKDRFSVGLQQKPGVSKTLGVASIIASFVLLVIATGLGVGTLFGFMVLMTVASLVILLSPLT